MMRGPDYSRPVQGVPVILMTLALILCLAGFLWIFYSLPVKDSLLWFAGVFLYFFIPGSLLLRYPDFSRNEWAARLFHSVALGAALMPLLYGLLRRLSLPELIYPLGAGMFLVWSALMARDIKERRIAVSTSYQDILSVLFLVLVIALLLHLSYFTDILFLKEGFRIRTVYLTETIFHLGIINVLKDVFPPFFPYASGYDFSHYHLSMHLGMELFNRLFSIGALKLTFFYFPLLYFCLLILIPFIFVRDYAGGRLPGVLTAVLLFGSDLSFIPGLLGMVPENYPWTIIFNTTIWSLFTLNGYLPALFIVFLSLFYLRGFYDHGRLPHLLIFALLGFAAYGFKSSMGSHMMGAALLTGIASAFFTDDKKKGRAVSIISALTLIVIIFDMALLRGGTGNLTIALDPFNGFLQSLGKLGMADISWAFYPAAFILYVAAAFGVRILGFYALRGVFRKRAFDPLIVFLAVFAVSGFFLSEMIYIGPPARDTGINNAVWFSVQSLMVAWLLLPYLFLRLKHRRRRFLLATLIIASLSLPTTIQFLYLRFDDSYHTVDADAMEVVEHIGKTPPESVVLHPLNHRQPSLASHLGGRSSVVNVFRSFVDDRIGKTEKINRMRDVESFFHPSGIVDRSFILGRYSVDYVYAPQAYAAILDSEPMLREVLKNNGYALYRVIKPE